MNKVKASLMVLGVTAAAVISMAATGAQQRGMPAAKVKTCRVEIGSVEQVLAVSGVLRYEMEYGAISPETGVVAQVYVRQGDEVQAGQPLFRLNGEAQAMTVSAALAGQGTLPEIVPAGFTSAQTQEAVAQMEWLTVRAAADGIVQQVNVSENGGVMAGTLAVALSGEEQSVQCGVVLRDAAKLQTGMRARIIWGDEVLTMAKVKSISPAQVSTATGQAICQVALAPEHRIDLPLGAMLDAEIVLYGQENVPVLPLQAITDAETVWWVAENRGYEIPAEMVMADEVNCWVNMPEGIMVVCGGEALQEGQRVKEMKP